MKKKFNITGLCVKDKHYMADISAKIDKIVAMIDDGEYFTINRPRQFGKTTALNILSQAVSGRYIVIDSSFEGVGDDLFQSEEELSRSIFDIWANDVKFKDKKIYRLLQKYNNSKNFRELSTAITDFIMETGKKVVLIIDEVDKSSNSRTFLQFLGLLRNKYLSASAGRDITFHSVVLAGVHDIRTFKFAIRDESETAFNSPWNIAAKFDVDMSFNTIEIESMLLNYQTETHIHFDTRFIAELIYMFTNGYPYLVSDICKTIDENLSAKWTEESVYASVRTILNEKNTLFEDVIKNIENNADIRTVSEEMLIHGKHFEYHPMVHENGIIYGIFRRSENKLDIHNRMFETYIYTYLVGKREITQEVASVPINNIMELSNGAELSLEKILLRFQSFMFEEFRSEDVKFYESQARLIFLAYLKPILNGRGFYFVEPQTRENKRFDVVIIYGKQKYIVELKIWNGEKYHEKGRVQLTEYLTIQNLNIGYMLVFNFNQNKERNSGWVSVDDKKLFEVFV